MNGPSVTRKAAEGLTVGDKLAVGELLADHPVEILLSETYPSGPGRETLLAYRPVGGLKPLTLAVGGNTWFQLATAAELDAHREAGLRAEAIAGIRSYAYWLETNPDVPIGYGIGAQVDLHDADGISRVRALAAKFGRPVRDDLDDRTQTYISIGSIEHRIIAWHREGRPAEPSPEPLAEHYEANGWIGPGTTGSAGIECVCGVTYDGFDTLAEARTQLSWHIADPTGQDYGRADTAEADDPTPVSPARVPLHNGAMTDGGLVDETPAGECGDYTPIGPCTMPPGHAGLCDAEYRAGAS